MKRLIVLIALPLVMLSAVASAQQAEFVNAGILPFSTETGEVRILLGYDAEEGHWSDFVGVCTPGENPRQTAIRQFTEEARGVYQESDLNRRMQGMAPVEIGNTHIFLVEVPEVSATQIERMAKDRGFEKTDYCWVPLTALLGSVDNEGADRARVPASCTADSDELFDLVGRNLQQGQDMRQRLLSPDHGASATSLGMSPRCGR